MGFIVKNTTFPNLLDLIIPHSCRGCGHIGDVLCNRCKNNLIIESRNICPNCKSLNPTGNCQKCSSLPPTFIVGNRSELIGQLIHDFKYNSTRALAKPLSKLLNSSLPILDGPVSIIPLPTINRHIRERGIDHTLLLAKNLQRIRGKEYSVEKLLLRAKNTTQVGANEKTRYLQAAQAYKINPKIKIDPEKTYVLLDDVWTTGASIKAALKILKTAKIKKIIIALLAVNRIN